MKKCNTRHNYLIMIKREQQLPLRRTVILWIVHTPSHISTLPQHVTTTSVYITQLTDAPIHAIDKSISFRPIATYQFMHILLTKYNSPLIVSIHGSCVDLPIRTPSLIVQSIMVLSSRAAASGVVIVAVIVHPLCGQSCPPFPYSHVYNHSM